MTEQEIRTTLRRVCEEIDRAARAVVYPSLVGAGIALSGCTPNVNLPYGAPPVDARYERHTEDAYVDKSPQSDILYDVPQKKDAGLEKDTRPDTVSRDGKAND